MTRRWDVELFWKLGRALCQIRKNERNSRLVNLLSTQLSGGYNAHSKNEFTYLIIIFSQWKFEFTINNWFKVVIWSMIFFFFKLNIILLALRKKIGTSNFVQSATMCPCLGQNFFYIKKKKRKLAGTEK